VISKLCVSEYQRVDVRRLENQHWCCQGRHQNNCGL